MSYSHENNQHIVSQLPTGPTNPDDQLAELKAMPKERLYLLSYDQEARQAPKLANEFLHILQMDDLVTRSGILLRETVSEQHFRIGALSVNDLAHIFCRKLLPDGEPTPEEFQYQLILDEFHETSEGGQLIKSIRHALLLDETSEAHPNNARKADFVFLDPMSVLAHWSRRLSHPIRINEQDGEPVANGHVFALGDYGLMHMPVLDAPAEDLFSVTQDLLYEAATLRRATIPDRAIVEINAPPFVALCLREYSDEFVIVEALDRQGRSLPVYLFPYQQIWHPPVFGYGPDGQPQPFIDMGEVVSMIAAAALRDFWVVESRTQILGAPRIKPVTGLANKRKRVVYLPRLRYEGTRNLRQNLDEATDIRMRAAHWRSDHFRKLPVGQQPSPTQLALADIYNREPGPGQTWVRGHSVAGEEVERVYRCRSVSRALFRTVPTKGRQFDGLNWFEFEDLCSHWLRDQGFEEVRRTVIDQGIDITAIRLDSNDTEEWVIQCKHWQAKVGPVVVRELEGARKLRNAHRAMLIVSSALTHGAIAVAVQLDVTFVDGDRIRRDIEVR